MIIRSGDQKWNRLDELCWEGFDKVRRYADGDIESLVNNYKGNYEDWCKFIDQISKGE